MRNHSTLGEILLWQQLRAAQTGYTFNRQKPLDRYIIDFYCKPLQLVIEVDGAYHFDAAQRIKDARRQYVLENLGLHFLRFEDKAITEEVSKATQKIADYITAFEKEHLLVKQSRRKQTDYP